jgi:hypothetical protein
MVLGQNIISNNKPGSTEQNSAAPTAESKETEGTIPAHIYHPTKRDSNVIIKVWKSIKMPRRVPPSRSLLGKAG